MTVTTEEDTSSLGRRVRSIREERGLSLSDVAFEVRSRYGRKVTGEAVRQYEVGKLKVESMDIVLLAQLLDIYGARPVDVSPVLAQRMEAERDLLVKTCSRCTDGGPGGWSGLRRIVDALDCYHAMTVDTHLGKDHIAIDTLECAA